jgi:hypothetical protein
MVRGSNPRPAFIASRGIGGARLPGSCHSRARTLEVPCLPENVAAGKHLTAANSFGVLDGHSNAMLAWLEAAGRLDMMCRDYDLLTAHDRASGSAVNIVTVSCPSVSIART